ncbi:MAG: hypothetical protein F4X34_05070, partial [Chloroflexi bacterium]|nr:hypothetical protein [Chloroflexota bacterium]
MTSELYRDITRNNLPTAAALLVLMIALALALACSGGGRASPECLDTLYSGRMDEKTREQLSQPVASMDHAARLATIKALTHQRSYRINAESAECGEFVRELEAWEDTDDGKEWHQENGGEVASVVSSFWGLGQCEDALNYDYILESLEGLLGGLNHTGYGMTWGEPLSSRSGDYTYQVSRDLRMDETFVDDRDFQEVEQYLECTVKADVNTRSRT